MLRTSLLPITLLSLAAAACARGGGAPAEPDVPRGTASEGGAGGASGDTLRVPFGRSAVHAPSAVRATLLSVVGDSRCPIDATCVWEGDAAVRLRLERGATTM